MKRSNRLIILIGVFLAIVAFMGVVLLASQGSGAGSSASPTSSAEATVTVVVAKAEIQVGQKITAAMLTTKTMTASQRDALGQGTYTNVGDVVNKIAGATIEPNQVILSNSFPTYGQVSQGQDFATSIDSGFVMMSIEVDQINGAGTLLVPGDHVDILLGVWTDQIKISGTKIGKNSTLDFGGGTAVTTKLVIQNRKILAVLLPSPTETSGAAASPTPSAASSAAAVTNNGQHMIVEVEVKPDEAEVIRWAQRAEQQSPQNYLTLALALRSDKDNDAPDVTTQGVTFQMLVQKWGVLPPDPRGILPNDIMSMVQF